METSFCRQRLSICVKQIERETGMSSRLSGRQTQRIASGVHHHHYYHHRELTLHTNPKSKRGFSAQSHSQSEFLV